jgi:hypothetical protein
MLLVNFIGFGIFLVQIQLHEMPMRKASHKEG